MNSTAAFSFHRGRSGLLPRLGQRAADRLAHHPPMHSQLLGHSRDRSDSELVLPANLLE